MSPRALAALVGRDVARTRGALASAGAGIVVGTAALVFFLALGLGARRVLLSEVFPLDVIELEPPRTSAGLLALLGGEAPIDGVLPAVATELGATPGAREVFGKLRFRFPSSARGGKELLGRELISHEMVGDGVDPALIEPELRERFQDPLARPGEPCVEDAACGRDEYCERASGSAGGRCSAPVPGLVSRKLVEVFDHAVAPQHGLPPVAGTLLARAEGVPFELSLGSSMLGVARLGAPRRARIRVVGVSGKAIDLGVTLPLAVVQRWNREYGGEAAATRWSSVVVRVASPADTAAVLAAGSRHGLVPADTRARDVSVLVSGVLALLFLVASVVLGMAALNIGHTFRALVADRRHEIGLYRAVGASAGDIRAWLLALAVTVGLLGGGAGVALAWVATRLADARARTDLPDFPYKPESFFELPAWLVALGVGYAVLFAVLGGLLPALRAARTDPAHLLGGGAR
ncbi:MAG: FtsX-like permease family protein [Polyangiaceae bacterium]|nr:FtsX-like permease family protein [Polyangiaceae bacterium]